jgi:transcriptional regulator with XRE-family HTH domain
MSYLGTYLDQVSERQGFRSDSELARFLDISRQHLSRIRQSGVMSDEKCLIIARVLNIDPLELFALMRARKAKSEDIRVIWLELHRQTKRVKDSILLNSNLDA